MFPIRGGGETTDIIPGMKGVRYGWQKPCVTRIFTDFLEKEINSGKMNSIKE